MMNALSSKTVPGDFFCRFDPRIERAELNDHFCWDESSSTDQPVLGAQYIHIEESTYRPPVRARYARRPISLHKNEWLAGLQGFAKVLLESKTNGDLLWLVESRLAKQRQRDTVDPCFVLQRFQEIAGGGSGKAIAEFLYGDWPSSSEARINAELKGLPLDQIEKLGELLKVYLQPGNLGLPSQDRLYMDAFKLRTFLHEASSVHPNAARRAHNPRYAALGKASSISITERGVLGLALDREVLVSRVAVHWRSRPRPEYVPELQQIPQLVKWANQFGADIWREKDVHERRALKAGKAFFNGRIASFLRHR